VIKPYLDTKVDQLSEGNGQIDSVPALSLDIPDLKIIADLEGRIEDSKNYWDQAKGFNLKTDRAKAVKMYLGQYVDEGQLYRFQIPYVENEIFVATETIVSYLTSQPPSPEVYPAQDSQQSKILASDLEKGLRAHAQKSELNRHLESAIRNLMIKRVGFLYLWYDPDYGQNGEIRVKSLEPDNVVIDKNAERGENPAFICIYMKNSIEELCYLFPDKKEAIMTEIGAKNQPQRMSQTIDWRQVWLTHYDDDGKPQEACVSYFGSLVLDKYKNPNWMYANVKKNFLDMPLKPIIPLNYINDGTHWIDSTTPLIQASWIQEVLNKRGRQIMENADAANGFLVISSDAMSMDDAENLTGDPNQKLVIDTKGEPIGDLITNIQGRELATYVIDDKIDLRNTVHSIMGTPPQMRGDDSSQAETLGENLMMKNQASGRQDLIVRAVDACLYRYFNYLVQMMTVHYTEKHFTTINSADGDFDFITLHRDLIEKGMSVTVKNGSTLPFDKSRQEAVAMNLAKGGLIDPLHLYEDLHMDNPQKRYDAWAKWKSDPMALARDAMDELDDTTAYIDWIETLAGKKVKPRDDATKEHILIHRKQMISDQFLGAARNIQNNFLAHVAAEVQSLQLRTDLDAMAMQGAMALAPQNPIQPAPPPAPPMGTPGMTPGAPGQAPMPPGAGMPPMGGQGGPTPGPAPNPTTQMNAPDIMGAIGGMPPPMPRGNSVTSIPPI
jgi:hypothetical protein